MKRENILDKIIIVLFILVLILISGSIKIHKLTMPKVIGLFVFGTFIFLLLTKKINLKNEWKQPLIKIFSIFLTSISIIALISTIINHKYQMTYLFEIVRPLVYISSILIFNYLFTKKDNVTFFNKILYFLIPFLLIISIIQFYNFGNINNYYIKTIAPTQFKTLINGYAYPRVVGLMNNPNVFGYIIALINLYLFYLLISEPKQSKWKRSLLIILIILSKITLYLTGSRTSFIICIFAELLFVFSYFIFKNKSTNLKSFIKSTLKSGIICIGILGMEALLLFSLPTTYTWRVKTLFVGDINSWEIRKDKTSEVLDDFKNENEGDFNNTNVKEEDSDVESITNNTNKDGKKPNKVLTSIFGYGAQKEGFHYDNEYVEFFISYGISGIILLIGLFIVPLYFIRNCTLLFKCYYISIISLNYLYMIPTASFLSYNLFISLLLFIFIVYRSERKKDGK